MTGLVTVTPSELPDTRMSCNVASNTSQARNDDEASQKKRTTVTRKDANGSVRCPDVGNRVATERLSNGHEATVWQQAERERLWNRGILIEERQQRTLLTPARAGGECKSKDPRNVSLSVAN